MFLKLTCRSVRYFFLIFQIFQSISGAYAAPIAGILCSGFPEGTGEVATGERQQ